jgi:hypothetical protein
MSPNSELARRQAELPPAQVERDRRMTVFERFLRNT